MVVFKSNAQTNAQSNALTITQSNAQKNAQSNTKPSHTAEKSQQKIVSKQKTAKNRIEFSTNINARKVFSMRFRMSASFRK